MYDIVKKYATEYDVDAITTEVLEAWENEKHKSLGEEFRRKRYECYRGYSLQT